MERDLARQGMLNHIRLAMNSYDLRLVLGGVARMLETYSEEVSQAKLQSEESAYIACRIADMQNIARSMLDNLGDIENSLAQVCPTIRQVSEILCCLEQEHSAIAGDPTVGLERKSLVGDLSELPPHIWYM